MECVQAWREKSVEISYPPATLHVATPGHPPVPAADSANYYREYLQARSSTAVTREGWAAAADINIVKLARNVLLTASVYLQIYSTVVEINI